MKKYQENTKEYEWDMNDVEEEDYKEEDVAYMEGEISEFLEVLEPT